MNTNANRRLIVRNKRTSRPISKHNQGFDNYKAGFKRFNIRFKKKIK